MALCARVRAQPRRKKDGEAIPRRSSSVDRPPCMLKEGGWHFN